MQRASGASASAVRRGSPLSHDLPLSSGRPCTIVAPTRSSTRHGVPASPWPQSPAYSLEVRPHHGEGTRQDDGGDLGRIPTFNEDPAPDEHERLARSQPGASSPALVAWRVAEDEGGTVAEARVDVARVLSVAAEDHGGHAMSESIDRLHRVEGERPLYRRGRRVHDCGNEKAHGLQLPHAGSAREALEDIAEGGPVAPLGCRRQTKQPSTGVRLQDGPNARRRGPMALVEDDEVRRWTLASAVKRGERTDLHVRGGRRRAVRLDDAVSNADACEPVAVSSMSASRCAAKMTRLPRATALSMIADAVAVLPPPVASCISTERAPPRYSARTRSTRVIS